jgi:hypothetical protein
LNAALRRLALLLADALLAAAAHARSTTTKTAS